MTYTILRSERYSHRIYQIRSNLITNSISLSTVFSIIGQNRKDKVFLSVRAEYVHHLHSSWEKSSTAAGISTAVSRLASHQSESLLAFT